MYGYIKMDAAYDSARTNNGNFVTFVNAPNAANIDDKELNMTANQTRLGMKIDGPVKENVKTTGKIEMDFYGGGTENKANPRMRHAYLEMLWLKEDFSILAGQTWDVISQINPDTLNFPVAWATGNIGWRRPQVRFTKGQKISKDKKIKYQLALLRQIGTVSPVSTPGDSGEDAGVPQIQGRIAYTFPGFKRLKSMISISGQSGKEEYDINAINGNFSIKSQVAGIGLDIPLTKKLKFKGFTFKGKNVDEFMGGIGQGFIITDTLAGVNSNWVNGVGAGAGAATYTSATEIETKGGWVQLQYVHSNAVTYTIGSSVDDPEDAILPNGAKEKNSSAWLNAVYTVNSATKIGVEFMKLKTDYKGGNAGEANRIQTSATFSF